MNHLNPNGGRTIPRYILYCLSVIVLAQLLVFYGLRLLIPYLQLHDLTLPLDRRIPLIPQWIVIYFLSFPFWVVSAYWIVSESPERGYRFTGVYLILLFLSGLMFVFFPATMERPLVPGDSFFPAWLRLLYRIDSPTNLCPSLHVLTTYVCWRGMMRSEIIPRWYRVFSFVFLLLVCFCILFVKQHVLVDIPAALVIGELSIRLADAWKPERYVLSRENAAQ